MGLHLISILSMALCVTRALGTFAHHYYRLPATFHPFQESASMPFSSDYDLELLQPMSQMPMRKHVPLYLIPQTSFHLYPTTAAHLPAIEIPLHEPLVLTGPVSDVVAPVGFNVFFRGSFCQFYTVALLAPVPPGIQASLETPLVINVMYAIPKRPEVQSLSHQNFQTKTRMKPTKTEKYPEGAQLVTTPDTISVDDSDTVSLPLYDPNESGPFENAKESPYLQELRLQSLQRQLQELQAQIRKIKRLRH